MGHIILIYRAVLAAFLIYGSHNPDINRRCYQVWCCQSGRYLRQDCTHEATFQFGSTTLGSTLDFNGSTLAVRIFNRGCRHNTSAATDACRQLEPSPLTSSGILSSKSGAEESTKVRVMAEGLSSSCPAVHVSCDTGQVACRCRPAPVPEVASSDFCGDRGTSVVSSVWIWHTAPH